MSASNSVWPWCDRRRNAGALYREYAPRGGRWDILEHRRHDAWRNGWNVMGLDLGTILAHGLSEIPQ